MKHRYHVNFIHANTIRFFKISLLLILLSGCVSIQHKDIYNRYFLPFDEQKIAEIQPYNCLFVQEIIGEPSNVVIYFDPREKDPPFLIKHDRIELKDNDLYNLTKGKPVYIPFQNNIKIDEVGQRGNITAYNLDFFNAWVFDSHNEKVKITDTNFWKVLKEENSIDEIQAYLVIKDKPDTIIEWLRYIFTLSVGSKDTTKQIHLRFKPRLNSISTDRPKCNY